MTPTNNICYGHLCPLQKVNTVVDRQYRTQKRRMNMKNAFIQLLKVKSIITIVLVGVFAFLCIIGQITAEQFMTIFSVVIAFYFGTQVGKKENDK